MSTSLRQSRPLPFSLHPGSRWAIGNPYGEEQTGMARAPLLERADYDGLMTKAPPISTRSTTEANQWYRDAVIYQLHVKTFCDGNEDGIGDFEGLLSKLDYLQNLGVTAIWLLPFYPSPLKDDGYDIAAYTKVHPQYGTLGDFKRFLREAHKRDLRVITELVINHTSDQHEWFQKSRRAKPGSKWRDFYVWSDTVNKYQDARIIFQDFETSNWTWDPIAKAYFWHRFYSHQPDLNFDNPEVMVRIKKIMDFWLSMGVDGLRLDAIPYLIERDGTNCENLPETHAILRELRTHVDENYQDRMLLAEANQWPEDAVAYFGLADECHMAFHFPLMPRMFMALHMEDRYPIVDILEQTPEIPMGCQWASFLRNHDELTLEMVTDEERDYMYQVYAKDEQARINLGIRRRLSPLLGSNRRKIELINVLLFSLPGTPIVYYGDEIGMGDNIYLGDRNGVRTPMQWSQDKNAGFSRANPQKLLLPIIIDPEHHYERINVELEENNLSSLLWWMRRVIAMRKRFPAFSRGDITFIHSENAKVLTFVREYKGEAILVVINLSRFTQVAELDLAAYAGQEPEEVYSHNPFPVISSEPYTLTLGPYDHYWLLLQKTNDETLSIDQKEPPNLRHKPDTRYWGSDRSRDFAQRILPRYLQGCRWFSGKARKVTRITIDDHLPMPLLDGRAEPAQLLLVEVHYTEGADDVFAVPVQFLEGAEAATFLAAHPAALITRYEGTGGSEGGALVDAVYDPLFHQALLQLMAGNRRFRSKQALLQGISSRSLERENRAVALPEHSQLLRTEQSNSSVIFESRFFLKLYRRLQEGTNPDIEMVRHLTEVAGYTNAPAFSGAIEYRTKDPKAKPIALGFLQSYTANEGDAWTVALGALHRYFDRVLAQRSQLEPVTDTSPEALANLPAELGALLEGSTTANTRLLAQRTAEMHLALAFDGGNKDFTAESFTLLYQRSVHHALREQMTRNFRLLRKRLPKLEEEIRELAEEALGLEGEINKVYRGLNRRKLDAQRIRIHGDFHLGQVLFTGRDFIIIDFEGEPARRLGERRLKRNPLRDVAGMLRSYHYAAYHALLQSRSIRTEDSAFLAGFADLWYAYSAQQFMTSYEETLGEAPFLPRQREDRSLLLRSFTLGKAIYEIGYELNNRPDWVKIPLRGILRLMAEPAQIA